jgi:hypothetical protein
MNNEHRTMNNNELRTTNNNEHNEQHQDLGPPPASQVYTLLQEQLAYNETVQHGQTTTTTTTTTTVATVATTAGKEDEKNEEGGGASSLFDLTSLPKQQQQEEPEDHASSNEKKDKQEKKDKPEQQEQQEQQERPVTPTTAALNRDIQSRSVSRQAQRQLASRSKSIGSKLSQTRSHRHEKQLLKTNHAKKKATGPTAWYVKSLLYMLVVLVV